jgi:F-type H+-transporting ATPase subunit b
MPQLDTTTFLSQISWLILIFGLLLLMVKFYFVPAVAEVVKGRRKKIITDLAHAERISAQQQDLRQTISNVIQEAQYESLSLKSEASRLGKEIVDKKLEEIERNLDQQVEKQMMEIDKLRDELKKEIPHIVEEVKEIGLKSLFETYVINKSNLN